jgi:hypothetical protein
MCMLSRGEALPSEAPVGVGHARCEDAPRDFTPIECLPDDCLLRDYDVPLPWQDGTPEAALQPILAS